MLRWQVTSRDGSGRLVATSADRRTDLEHAARFPYLPRAALGGRISARNLGETADQLARLRGRFVLSLNDRPEVRDTFLAFDIRGVCIGYSIGRDRAGREGFGEALIRN